ncbi:small ribosomal subunit protein mS40 isoform X2 [Struthio camelus]|uniref:small ribosomal subunit protein mS40 isoform X2 n=1 Tax=Struthio camelus TaxID=8801 RepID=UPI003603F61F
MALARSVALLRGAAGGLRGPVRAQRPLWAQFPPQVTAGASARPRSTPAPPDGPPEPPAFDAASRYKDKPWEYLETEEYHATYGDRPVWFGYRRNHKGAIPPQRTRKACLRKGKPVGNPCPICRDRNLFLDFRNVKLLDQFICPHSGVIYHPTYTGVCMKQHKLLTKAVEQARDHGLLWLQVPYVAAPREDYSNRHAAVSKTPPAPELLRGAPWYPWYDWRQPPAADVARLRRIYKGYLKEDGPPA